MSMGTESCNIVVKWLDIRIALIIGVMVYCRRVEIDVQAT